MSSDTASPSTNAFVWGYNNTGGLGLGHTARAYRPVPIRLPAGIVDVQAGVEFSVALTSSGALYSWGGNGYGQLGDGSSKSRRKPGPVALPRNTKVTQIRVGTDHVLALTNHGQVLAWGRNHHGQIGNGSAQSQLAPLVVHSDTVSLGAGDASSAAIDRRGELYTWGRNGSGQLATRANLTKDVTRPALAVLPRGVKAAAVEAGRRHLTVLTTAGQLVMFGVDALGRPEHSQLTPKAAWGRIREISAGDDYTLALTSRNILLAWGANHSGQLGVGDLENRLTLAVVTLPRAEGHITAVAAGARSAVAITSAHEVYAWGDSTLGQCGLGRLSAGIQPKPTKLASLDGATVTAVYGGGHHTILTAVRGPAVGLRLDPQLATVRPGESVTYRVHAVDAFGTDLGPGSLGHVTLSITHGEAVAKTARASTPGAHQVTARAGKLTGSATLVVKNGK